MLYLPPPPWYCSFISYSSHTTSVCPQTILHLLLPPRLSLCPSTIYVRLSQYSVNWPFAIKKTPTFERALTQRPLYFSNLGCFWSPKMWIIMLKEPFCTTCNRKTDILSLRITYKSTARGPATEDPMVRWYSYVTFIFECPPLFFIFFPKFLSLTPFSYITCEWTCICQWYVI